MPLISSFYGMYINSQDFSCLFENQLFYQRRYLSFGKLAFFTKDVSCLLENRPFLPKTLKAFQKQRFIL